MDTYRCLHTDSDLTKHRSRTSSDFLCHHGFWGNTGTSSSEASWRSPNQAGIERGAHAADAGILPLSTLTNSTFASYAILDASISIWIADDRGMRFHVSDAPAYQVVRDLAELNAMVHRAAPDANRLEWLRDRLWQALIEPIHYLLSPERELRVHMSDGLDLFPLGLLLTHRGQSFGDLPPYRFAMDFPGSAHAVITDALPSESRPCRVLSPQDLRGPAKDADTLHLHYRNRGRQTDGKADDLLDALANEELSHCHLVCLDMDLESMDRGLVRGIVQMLHVAGARQVLFPLWDIPVPVKQEFFARFYASLDKNRSISTALRTATNSLRQSNAWNHPRYWDCFQCSCRHNVSSSPALEAHRDADAANRVRI